MFKKNLVKMVVVVGMVVSSTITSFAGMEYYDGGGFGYNYYDGEIPGDEFRAPSMFRRESETFDLKSQLSYSTYISPGMHNVATLELTFGWYYGTIALVDDYGENGYEIWITGYDPAYPDGAGWTVSSTVPADSTVQLQVGDTVVVNGATFPYDDGFSNEIYTTGAVVIVTDKSFDEVMSIYNTAPQWQ
uniref:hypothetical protein n=1 Tax=Enterocloster hominis (ex Hitch et al. 2024) TaxID=1917870 RepID=UPI0010307A03|nr:hypothetical protein [Lachnoclostridium pacaense]